MVLACWPHSCGDAEVSALLRDALRGNVHPGFIHEAAGVAGDGAAAADAAGAAVATIAAGVPADADRAGTGAGAGAGDAAPQV